ncbi:hypothetical protein DSM3645_02828 [Blastopirellula marina DSM 3645]|uniref:Uncharacterized protein n=1 Tax=Blastopirellula marina DSM 3645 TaxID=314230 RepID=A3ZVM9_9BACT|nr:hypothetical protein DSM3645_02828 [Blastopirellula marina DSM 3645]
MRQGSFPIAPAPLSVASQIWDRANCRVMPSALPVPSLGRMASPSSLSPVPNLGRSKWEDFDAKSKLVIE